MRLFCLLITVAILFPLKAHSEETEFAQRLKLAEEVVMISQADQLGEQIADGIVVSQMQALEVILAENNISERQRREIAEEMAVLLAEELEPAMQTLSEKMAPLLADVYTLAELDGILEFYKSPAGKAMLEKQPELIEKSMLIGQEWNAENPPKVMERIRPRIQKIVEDALKGI